MKHLKKLFPVICGALSLCFAFSLFACGGSNGGDSAWFEKGTSVPEEAYVLPSAPTFGAGASVHDPSVFHDPVSGKYYAFGSHFAVASSDDLISWKQELSDVTDLAGAKRQLFGTDNFREVLQASDEIVGGNENIWAPDVERIGNKYYLYYSLTSGFGSNKSVIGRVESSNVLGPYSNETIIVRTGGGGEPNAIDPELFYSADGRLWMVYGSFYAGIYIRELNATGDKAGLPKEGGEKDFGKLLWKGGSAGVEGPFIFYNAETEYYYLMTSDGNLRDGTTGRANYSMHVARSKNPDGPYTDIAGKDMASAYGGGNKLAGNYQFAGETGYGAQGHNSVVKKDGKYLVVAHVRTRTSSAGEEVSLGHSIIVNQLFFNEDGWPVLSPDRYAGESNGKVTQAQAAGTYDVIEHTGRDGNAPSFAFATSEQYTFGADGKILKGTAEAGSWTVKQDYYVEITLGDVVYKGVIAPAWRQSKTAGVLTMTAVSSSGRALWVNGVAAPAAE